MYRVMEAFLKRKREFLGYLESAGPVLRYGTHILAEWRDDELLWNPFPPREVAWRWEWRGVQEMLRSFGYGPVGHTQSTWKPTLRGFPLAYAAFLRPGGREEFLRLPDSRLQEGTLFSGEGSLGCWELGLWDARCSRYKFLDITLPPAVFPKLLELQGQELWEFLARAWVRQKKLHRAKETTEEIMGKIKPMCKALSLYTWYAEHGHPYHRLARARELWWEVHWNLDSPEGLGEVLSRV